LSSGCCFPAACLAQLFVVNQKFFTQQRSPQFINSDYKEIEVEAGNAKMKY
jgi:hypothetical protein